jgi:hypothetical protein
MRSIRIFALVGVTLAAAISISSAGAGPSGAKTLAKVDLSNRAAVNRYLRTIGVNPATVVVQRGARNYAGTACPGRRWNCTKARRVVQISTRGTWNRFDCSASNADAPYPSPPATHEPDTCLVVQSSNDGANVAVCRERSEAPTVTQTCTIIQQNSRGANRARVRQVVDQDEEQTADATQRAEVTQHNGSGKNVLKIVQKIGQSADTYYSNVAQDLESDQKFTITQDAVDGPQRAKIDQSTSQDAEADEASSGSQHEDALLVGDVVHQTSAGKSTIDVSQSEDQNEEAPPDSGVQQTIVGPFDCCTGQGTNPADDFEIDQKSVQRTTSSSAQLSEEMSITCESSGTCDGSQSADENGEVTTNSCSAVGSRCEATLQCTNEECSTESCSGEGCDSEPPPPPILLGDPNVGPAPDYTAAGLAEAFRATAGASGTPGRLKVYVDSGSAATTLKAGIYSDNDGHPGALLTSGSLSSPAPGAWNEVVLGESPPVAAGTTYWIAVLSPKGAGTLRFRDHCCGSGSPSETSSQQSLYSLPASWTTGTVYHDGSLSGYATP